jgi:hypothetical protein
VFDVFSTPLKIKYNFWNREALRRGYLFANIWISCTLSKLQPLVILFGIYVVKNH